MKNEPTDEFKITDPAEMLVLDDQPLTTHPGVFLREVILPQWGLTKIAPLARMLGVNRPNLHNVLHGTSDVSRELAYRFGALLGDHAADFLIAYQNRWDLEQEKGRREELKRQIPRLPIGEAAS